MKGYEVAGAVMFYVGGIGMLTGSTYWGALFAVLGALVWLGARRRQQVVASAGGSIVVPTPASAPRAQASASTSAVLVRRYRGSQAKTSVAFEREASRLAKDGYVPVSQVWAPGSWGPGAFLVALVLCLVLVGIFVFIYMLLVKPAGTLTVSYEKRTAELATKASWIVDAPAQPSSAAPAADVRTLKPRILPGGYRVEVVGESYYAAALDTIADDGATQAWADLVVEDDNPYDPNAVRVEIDGQKVGHLSREIAPTYRPVGLRLRELGFVGRCAATIHGNERRKLFGVVLDLAAPDVILKELHAGATAS